ncbi:MAG: YraN family protein [Clostridia bacterium]|jgi:putative endonuclease|nr:YraN family protein [Clostridia bacterium]
MSNLKLSRKLRGNIAEFKVRLYLVLNGYRILDSNFYSPYGEIDIVCKKKKTLIFAEVRSRSENLCVRYGTPAESVNYKKQQNIIKSAKYYLKFCSVKCETYRFDVIEAIIPQNGGIKINHIKDAFISK